MLLFDSIQKWEEFIEKQGVDPIPEQIENEIVVALYLTIPFIYCTFSTRKDYYSRMPFKSIFKRWLVRLTPLLGLYYLLHYDIHRAITLGLPGASTASIALLPFPFIGALYIFIANGIMNNINALKEK